MSEATPIREEDLKAFAAKIDEWGMSLPPEQRALLQVLLDRSAAVTGDVQGFEAMQSIYLTARSSLAASVQNQNLRLSQGATGGKAWYQVQDRGSNKAINFGPFFDTAWHAM
ncbi:MAG: hypothetical protein HY720_27925 [Planctomycetes bacterium]|nr:hypothetical protein [Planctomycetota bacterium]